MGALQLNMLSDVARRKKELTASVHFSSIAEYQYNTAVS